MYGTIEGRISKVNFNLSKIMIEYGELNSYDAIEDYPIIYP
jgi:hypothetical protein